MVHNWSLAAGQEWMLFAVVALALVFMSFLLLLVKRYRRCPSNKVLVVYGKVKGGQTSKTLHGGSTLVWPLIQNYAYLDLEPMQIEVPLKGALSIENIRVNVPSVFTVAIGTDPHVMQNAAVRLLGLHPNQIVKQAEDIIFGQLRQVIASMSIEDINRDRDQFLESIQRSLEPELLKIGLVLINVNMTDITDESGYIAAIGRKAAAEAVQSAEIDVANQEKRGAIGVAEAERERAVQVANATKVREIGTKQADRERAVKVAELEKETVVGEQSAAYEREAQVKAAERQMRIDVADANAKAVGGENVSKAEVAQTNAELRVREADSRSHAVQGENVAQATVAESNATLKVKQSEAFQRGETRDREAQAAVKQAEYVAETEANKAKAQMIETEKRAELESVARAQKAETIVRAEATAERQRIEAEGEAAAIFAKLEAKARGEYEILAKKGDGLKAIVDGCGSAQAAFQLLMIENLQGLSETAAKAISNVKFDKVVVWDSGNNSADGSPGGAAGFLQSLGRSLPPMLSMMKDIGGVEMPEFLGRLMDPEEADKKLADAAPESKGHGKGRKKTSPRRPGRPGGPTPASE